MLKEIASLRSELPSAGIALSIGLIWAFVILQFSRHFKMHLNLDLISKFGYYSDFVPSGLFELIFLLLISYFSGILMFAYTIYIRDAYFHDFQKMLTFSVQNYQNEVIISEFRKVDQTSIIVLMSLWAFFPVFTLNFVIYIKNELYIISFISAFVFLFVCSIIVIITKRMLKSTLTSFLRAKSDEN
jgi:hypothetical protein